MPKFVELWVYLSATPLFGPTATLVVYILAQAAYTRLGQAPWANPVLWTVRRFLPAVCWLPARLTPVILQESNSFISCWARPWWRWLGRCGCGVKNCATAGGWAARGFALGTSAHGIGAARAMHVNDDAGAYAGPALGLQVVLASLLIPLAFRLF